MDPFEDEVRRALERAADGVTPGAGLEERVLERIRRRRRRGPAVAGAAVVALVAVVSAVALPREGGRERSIAVTGPSTTVGTPATTTALGGPTTTEAVPSTIAAPSTTTPSTTVGSTQPPALPQPTTTVGPAPVCPGRAPSVGSVLATSLPRALYGAGSVWDGRYGYILGGAYGIPDGVAYSDQILRFDPTDGQVTTLPSILPAGIGFATAVFDGSAVYLFGGYNTAAGYWAGIVRFEPGTGQVRTLPQTLPLALANAASVWSGGSAYLFGGDSQSLPTYHSDRIISFTPASGEAKVVSERLPVAGGQMAAAWDGRRAVVIGGGSGTYGSDKIDRVTAYDPVTNKVTGLGTLPSPQSGMSAVAACDQVLVVGGVGAEGQRVLRVDPAAGRVTVVGTLARPVINAVLLWNGDTAWVLGGLVPVSSNQAEATAEILRFGPPR